jgi:proliferating cell nuclear antigen
MWLYPTDRSKISIQIEYKAFLCILVIMEIQLNQPGRGDIFTSLFQHIKLFTDNINVNFQPDRMFIQAMDSSRVSILELYLPKSWFDVYTIEQSNGMTIGINTNLLYKVLHAREKNQRLCIQLDETGGEKLQLHMSSDNTSHFDKHFEVPLLDIDSEMMSIPEMEYQAEFSLPAITFATLIDQLKLFGDNLRIECSEEKIQLFSESTESGKMMVDIPIDDLTSFAIEDKQELNLSFSLIHLHNICLYSKITKDIEIAMTTNYPLRIQYILDDANAKIVFYLAPKIDD